MKENSCRLCNGSLSEPVLSFPDTPLANEFLKTKEPQDTFPLQVCVCETCEHYQLNETVDPERLFRHYLFVAGTSKVNVEHFRRYADTVTQKCKLPLDAKVLDIASNDGTLLRQFKNLGMTVLGIDPARNLAEEATKSGIPTIPEFFTDEFAETILKQHGQFDLITANNVFAHVPDMTGFAKGVQKLLKPNGVFTFEVSHFVDVCDHLAWDTVYHEHTSYHTIRPLVEFFRELGMQVFDVEKINTHGGSIRVFVRAAPSMLHSWQEANIFPLFHENMREKVERLKKDIKLLGYELREQLDACSQQGSTVVIYGVPAKATTLMYALGIDEKNIKFAVDDNPLKQGTFTPGKHIPVMHPDVIYTKQPDYLLILAWNFADSLIEKCKQNGYTGKFIVPLPQLKVL